MTISEKEIPNTVVEAVFKEVQSLIIGKGTLKASDLVALWDLTLKQADRCSRSGLQAEKILWRSLASFFENHLNLVADSDSMKKLKQVTHQVLDISVYKDFTNETIIWLDKLDALFSQHWYFLLFYWDRTNNELLSLVDSLYEDICKTSKASCNNLSLANKVISLSEDYNVALVDQTYILTESIGGQIIEFESDMKKFVDLRFADLLIVEILYNDTIQWFALSHQLCGLRLEANHLIVRHLRAIRLFAKCYISDTDLLEKRTKLSAIYIGLNEHEEQWIKLKTQSLELSKRRDALAYD